MWKKSGLKKGELIRIPDSILISGYTEHFIRAEYVGETKHGIMLELFFKAGFSSEEPTWSYKYFVNWTSVYCGNIKLKSFSGHDVVAVMERRRK